jgi:hypothetical protein
MAMRPGVLQRIGAPTDHNTTPLPHGGHEAPLQRKLTSNRPVTQSSPSRQTAMVHATSCCAQRLRLPVLANSPWGTEDDPSQTAVSAAVAAPTAQQQAPPSHRKLLLVLRQLLPLLVPLWVADNCLLACWPAGPQGPTPRHLLLLLLLLSMRPWSSCHHRSRSACSAAGGHHRQAGT